MHSPALAIAWQIWRRHRLGLTIVVGLVLAASILLQASPAGSFETTHGYLFSMQFIFVLFYVVAVFAYASESALESGTSGFPSRQFTLPVRTAELIFWPMLLGVGAIALLWTAWAYFVLRRTGVEISLGQSALQAAAIAAVLQALLWWPFGVPWVRIIGAVVLLPFMALAPIFAVMFEIEDRWLSVVFAVLIPCAFVAAIAGVSKARHGDTPVWRWRAAYAETRALPAEPVDTRRPFTSAARALVWFERRQHLLSFPLVVGCAAMLHLLLIFWLEEFAENKLRLGSNFLVIPLLFAPILGSRLGRTGSTPRNAYALSAFTATRPSSTAALVAAKLKATTLSALTAWGVLLLLASIWFFGTDVYQQAPGWWRWMRSHAPLWKIAATVLLISATLFVLTWRLMVDSLCPALTGRPWIAYGNLCLHGVALTVGMIIGAEAMSRNSTMQALRDALPWLAGTAVALKLATATCVIRALNQRGLLSTTTIRRFLAIWVLTAAAFFGLAWAVIPADVVSVWWIVCGVVLILPLTRLAATPLALAWNRHR